MTLRRSYALSLLTALVMMAVAPFNALSAQEAPVQNNEGTSLSQSSDKAKQVGKAKQFLMGELDNLIPGKLDGNEALKAELERAVALFIEGKRKETSEILKAEAAKDPSFPPIELLQAGLTYGAGDATTGFRILEAAGAQHPGYPGIYFAFARLAVSQSRLTDAIALLDKAQQTMQANNFSKAAVDHFNTQLYDTQIDIGMRRKDQEMVKKAVDGLQSVQPDSPKVLMSRAELAFMDKDYRSSLAQLKGFHQANPKSQVPELVMASWFQQDGNVPETKNWITKAAEVYPDSAAVQLEFANYVVTLGEFPEAKRAIKRVEISAGKELPATLLLKAKIAFADEAYSVAEIHYGKLAQAQPNSFDLTNMYALCLIESDSEEKQKQAATIVQRNYQQVPDNYVAQAAFGWIMLRLGKKDEAKALFSRAARAPQLAPEVAYFLANYMHQSGSSKQAKLVLEPAVEATGLFLYRKQAARLLSSISEETQGALPNPGQ